MYQVKFVFVKDYVSGSFIELMTVDLIFGLFCKHGNRIALAVYSLGPADRLRLGQESKCNCFSFDFYK